VHGNKLLAIGLDGGDLYYIRSRLDHLPNLAKLVQRAEICEPVAPQSLSGSVWPTFYTASDPGHHGIYQHLLWDPVRMGLRRINASGCRRVPFWVDLDNKGFSSIIIDVPYCFSNRLDNGIEILDWGSHGQTMPTAANTDKVKRLVEQFGPSPIGRETPIRKGPGELARVQSVLKQSAERKADLLLELMNGFEWDLCLPVFAETHRGGHIFFSDQDLPQSNDVKTPLLEVYQAVDRAIGRLIESVDPQTTSVMVFSVHGMMPDNNQSGLVTRVIKRINEKFMADRFGMKPKSALGAGATPFARGLVNGIRECVPDAVQLAVAKAAPDAFRAWVVEQEIIGGIDWARTPAFALRTDIRSEIRLNLKGREKNGWLEAGSPTCAAYVQFMKDVFLTLEDVDRGHTLVEEVVSIPAIFPGRHATMLPDYAVRWKEVPLARRVHSPMIGDIELELYGVRGGDHRDEGFVLFDAAGPAPAGDRPGTTSEIAPFIAQILGAKVGNRAARKTRARTGVLGR